MPIIVEYSGCSDCCPAPGVDLCGCTGVPETLTATVTAATGGCSTGDTAVLTYNSGTSTWTGTFTTCSDISLTLRCFGGTTWKLALEPASCFLTAEFDGVGTCDPFSWEFGGYTYLYGGSCLCCSSGGTLTITITA